PLQPPRSTVGVGWADAGVPPGAGPLGPPLLLMSPVPPLPPAVPRLPPAPPPEPPESPAPLMPNCRQPPLLAPAPLRPATLETSTTPPTATLSAPISTSGREPVVTSEPDTVTVLPAITHSDGPPGGEMVAAQSRSVSRVFVPSNLTSALGGV